MAKFLITCDDKQRDKFVSFISSMPDLPKITGKKSDASGKPLTAEGKIEKLTDQAMKANKKLNRAEAYRQVITADDNRKLVVAYNKELQLDK